MRKMIDRLLDWYADWTSLVWIGAFVVAALALIALIGNLGGADGHHTCIIIAVEDQDNFTWDSTVVYTKTDPEASNEHKFCVVDPAIRAILDEASRTRRRVVIHFQNDLILWRWECNGGGSTIVGVEDAPQPEIEKHR